MLTKSFFLKRKIQDGVEFVYIEDEPSETSESDEFDEPDEPDEPDELRERIEENINVRENEAENNNQVEAQRSTSEVPIENRQELDMSIDNLVSILLILLIEII